MELVRFPVLKEEFYGMYLDVMRRGYPALVFGIYSTVTSPKVKKKEAEELLHDISLVLQSLDFFSGFSNAAFDELSSTIEENTVDCDTFDARLYLNNAIKLLKDVYEMAESVYNDSTFAMKEEVDSILFVNIANYLLAAGINEYVGEPSYNDAVFGTVN